jgi:hypothetical protein
MFGTGAPELEDLLATAVPTAHLRPTTWKRRLKKGEVEMRMWMWVDGRCECGNRNSSLWGTRDDQAQCVVVGNAFQLVDRYRDSNADAWMGCMHMHERHYADGMRRRVSQVETEMIMLRYITRRMREERDKCDNR